MAYLAVYSIEVSDSLFYLKVIQKYNTTKYKLGCNDKFHFLNKNNIWKLVL